MEEGEDLVHVVIGLPERTGIGSERVWAKALGNDEYEIRNSPWYTDKVSWGDVVRAVSDDPDHWPSFVEVVKPSGHKTLQIFFARADQEDKPEILQKLNELHATYENNQDTHYAVDVSPEADYSEIVRYLSQLAGEGKLRLGTTEQM